MRALGEALGLVPWGQGDFDPACVRDFLAGRVIDDLAAAPAGAQVHTIDDSREGWAKAVEILEAMAFRCESDRVLLLDFSDIRCAGSPIGGMQGRPASGPISLMRRS